MTQYAEADARDARGFTPIRPEQAGSTAYPPTMASTTPSPRSSIPMTRSRPVDGRLPSCTTLTTFTDTLSPATWAEEMPSLAATWQFRPPTREPRRHRRHPAAARDRRPRGRRPVIGNRRHRRAPGVAPAPAPTHRAVPPRPPTGPRRHPPRPSARPPESTIRERNRSAVVLMAGELDVDGRRSSRHPLMYVRLFMSLYARQRFSRSSNPGGRAQPQVGVERGGARPSRTPARSPSLPSPVRRRGPPRRVPRPPSPRDGRARGLPRRTGGTQVPQRVIDRLPYLHDRTPTRGRVRHEQA